MATAGDLVVNLGLNSSKFISGISGAAGKITSFASKTTQAFATFGMAAQGVNTAIGLISKLKGPVKLAADAEMTEVAFKTMLGSAEAAKKTIGDLTKFSDVTPFEPDETIAAGRAFLAVGADAQSLIPTLTMIGNMASMAQIPFGELATMMAKMRAENRVMAEELNQLGGRGIPVVQALANQFGVTESQVRDLASAGKIAFSDLERAMMGLYGAGGKFGNLMDETARTSGGLWSTFQGGIAAASKEFGKLILDGFNVKASLEGLIATAKTFTEALVAAAPDIKMVFGDVSEIFGRMSQDLTGATNNLDAMRNSMVFVVNILKQVAVWIERIQKADFAGINNLIRMISGSGMAGPEVKPTAAPKTPTSTGPATTPDAKPVVAPLPPVVIPQAAQDMAQGITDKLRNQAKKMADELQTPLQAFEEKVKAISPLLRGGAEDQKLYNDAVAGLRKELREGDPLWKAAKELFENTRTPLEQFNAEMAKLDELARKGVPRELLDRGLAGARKKFQESDPLAKAQKAMREDAKKYAKAARTPTQVFQDEIAKLKALRDLGPGRGGISQEVFNKSALAAEKEAAKELAEGKVGSKEGVGAIEAGSAAAFSAIAGAMRQKEEVKQLQKIEGHLREMARKTQPATVLSFGDV